MPIPVDPIATKKIAFLFILLLPLVFFVFLLVDCTIIALVPIWLPFAVPFAEYKSFPNKYKINMYCTVKSICTKFT